jgi:hypothetical protein
VSAHKKTIAMLVLLCAALQLRAQDCAAKETKFGLSPQMLQFDNQGQSFVSGLYQDGLNGLLESTRLWSVCKTQDFDAAARYAALGAQAFLAFRLQFANAYVLHEYAHAESATRLRLSNVRVGADEGHSVKAAPYLANLAHMAFDPRQLGDLGPQRCHRRLGQCTLTPGQFDAVGCRGAQSQYLLRRAKLRIDGARRPLSVTGHGLCSE